MQKKNIYEEIRRRHQEEINSFPIIWLFGSVPEEELKKEFAKIGAQTIADIVSIGNGGYINKEKAKDFLSLMERHEKECREWMKDSDYLYNMFLTEMSNHEYGCTLDPYETLAACGLTWEALVKDRIKLEAWSRAERKCKECFIG